VKKVGVLSFFSTTVLLLTLIAMPSASAERESIQVCNQTKYPLEVANAYKNNDVWKTEGWFLINSNRCLGMYPKKTGLKDHYLYAENKLVRYTGEHTFCVYRTAKKFEVSGADRCRGKQRDGSEPVKFVKITHMPYEDICISPSGIKVCK
jgi:uncharacterized membrane protein